MKRIAIRTLGGKGIGYGHYYRCLSLAKAFKQLEKDVGIIFIVNQELGNLIGETEFDFIVVNDLKQDYETIDTLNIDLFIFDSYLGSNRYLEAIKEKTKIMLIDDNNDIYDSTIPDIIYNGNIHATKLGYQGMDEQLKLLGPRYLIMKEEYWEDLQDKKTHKEGLLITTGGTDEFGVAFNILREVKDLDIKITVIIGPGYRDGYIKKIEEISTKNIELIYKPSSLKKYIASSKMVITAGGSTVYEVLSQKSIPIVFSIAENQDLMCKELSEMGIDYLGKYPNIEYTLLLDMIEKVQKSEYLLNNRVFTSINNQGAKAIAKILLSMV